MLTRGVVCCGWLLLLCAAAVLSGTGPLPPADRKNEPRTPGLEILEIKVPCRAQMMVALRLVLPSAVPASRTRCARLPHAAASQEDFVKFVLSDTDVSMANSLRR